MCVNSDSLLFWLWIPLTSFWPLFLVRFLLKWYTSLSVSTSYTFCTARYVKNDTEILHCTLKFSKQVKTSTLQSIKVLARHWKEWANSLKLVAPEVCASTVKYSSICQSCWSKLATFLKLASAIFYQIFIFSQNDSHWKTMKNVFYFI